MGFIEAIKSCFKKYVSIKGRAPRSEYWYFTLFLVLLGIAAGTLDVLIFGIQTLDSTSGGPIEVITSLATLIPSITVAVRRLHDINKSGFYICLTLAGIIIGFIAVFTMTSSAGVIIGVAIGIVSVLWYLWWMIKPSDPGPNRFGPNPFNETEDLAEVFE